MLREFISPIVPSEEYLDHLIAQQKAQASYPQDIPEDIEVERAVVASQFDQECNRIYRETQGLSQHSHHRLDIPFVQKIRDFFTTPTSSDYPY
jgi:hypothetical protein